LHIYLSNIYFVCFLNKYIRKSSFYYSLMNFTYSNSSILYFSINLKCFPILTHLVVFKFSLKYFLNKLLIVNFLFFYLVSLYKYFPQILNYAHSSTINSIIIIYLFAILLITNITIIFKILPFTINLNI